MKASLPFVIAFIILIGCNNNQQLQIFQEKVDQLKTEHVPDKRVKLFDISVQRQNGKVVFLGRTNQLELKQELLAFGEKQNLEVVDSIRVLPDGDLKAKPFGVVNVSVANLRSEPKHSAELSTQALLGTVLRVLDVQNDFYLVQTPDDYLGWLDAGGFVLSDSFEMGAYLNAPRAIALASFSFVYLEPSLASQKVTDIVAGGILRISNNASKGFWAVTLPDGRQGFAQADDMMPLRDWLNQPEPDQNHILQTGLEMMGRPYLWGGTSGKGMDCSGFTKMTYFLNGVQLPRDASQQVNVGILLDKDTTLSSYQPGDLLFFGSEASGTEKEKIWHVAMYLGNGKILHASERVMIQSLRRSDADFTEKRLNTLVRGRRILGSIGSNGVIAVKDLPWYAPNLMN